MNLILLLASTTLKIDEFTSEFLLKLNRFQLEGRYPDYFNQIKKICNENFTKQIINESNELRLWLIEKLQ